MTAWGLSIAGNRLNVSVVGMPAALPGRASGSGATSSSLAYRTDSLEWSIRTRT